MSIPRGIGPAIKANNKERAGRAERGEPERKASERDTLGKTGGPRGDRLKNPRLPNKNGNTSGGPGRFRVNRREGGLKTMRGANGLHDGLPVKRDRMLLNNDNLGPKGRNDRHVGHKGRDIDGKARNRRNGVMGSGPGNASFAKPNDRAKSGNGTRNMVANGSSRASKHEHSGSKENTKLNAPADETGLTMHATLTT